MEKLPLTEPTNDTTQDYVLSQAVVRGVLKALQSKLRGPDPIDDDVMLTVRSLGRTLHMSVEDAMELALRELERLNPQPA